jgi:propionyl-CoA carboxylase alpha chain
MQHPRFIEGHFDTAFIAEEYPKGFRQLDVHHRDPLLLAAAAVFARHRYVGRAVKTTGRLAGHERKIENAWVVLMGHERYLLEVEPIDGGIRVRYGTESHDLQSSWKIGQTFLHGMWDGVPVTLQVERRGIRYRVMHDGVEIDATVMTLQAAELLARMPEKTAPDLSRFLLSPMPGLLREVAVAAGEEVKAGEKLAVIEAMKMENILKADSDGVVEAVLANAGDSVAVDQPILRFR